MIRERRSSRRALPSTVRCTAVLVLAAIAASGCSTGPSRPAPPDVSGNWRYTVIMQGGGWECIGVSTPSVFVLQTGGTFTGTHGTLEFTCTNSTTGLEIIQLPAGQLTGGHLTVAPPSWDVAFDFAGLWSHTGVVSALAGRAQLMIGTLQATIAIPGIGTILMDGTWDASR